MILFVLIAYIVIAAASIFFLIMAASKADIITHCQTDMEDLYGYVICGFLWPLCLLPCLAYIGARWYIKNHEE